MNQNFNERLEELLSRPREIDMSKLKKVYDRLRPFTNMSYENFGTYVRERINENDPFVLEAMSKNPVKQNVYENLQIKMLSEYFGFPIKQRLTEKFPNTKTFDGKNDEHKVIFNCKYIKESGGGQDNQFNDLLKFNQTWKDYTNYLVISGKRGIEKMRKANLVLQKGVKVIIMDNTIEIIGEPEQPLVTNTQHYSTKVCLIEGFEVPKNIPIIEPFAGDMSLIKLLNITSEVEAYDIEPHSDNITQQDTLNNPPDYTDKFVTTNPPYKAKNHLTDEEKKTFNLPEGVSDLYQLFIYHLIDTPPKGGILILPINFIIGDKTSRIREDFLKSFTITKLNLYTFKTFENTTQSVCSFEFFRRDVLPKKLRSTELPIAELYTSETEHSPVNVQNPFEKMTKSKEFMRGYNVKKGFKPLGVVIGLIDPNMKAEECDENQTDIISDRCKFTVYTTSDITREDFITRFNAKLSEIREQYPFSLSTFRDNRHRLSFDDVLKIIGEM